MKLVDSLNVMAQAANDSKIREAIRESVETSRPVHVDATFDPGLHRAAKVAGGSYGGIISGCMTRYTGAIPDGRQWEIRLVEDGEG